MRHSGKTLLLVLALIAGMPVNAQDPYELLFLKGEYEQLYEISGKLTSEADYYWQAVSLEKQGKTLEAIRILDQGSVLYQENTLLEPFLAELLFKTGQYSRARPLLLKYPDDPELFIQLITILEFENNNSLAIEYLDQKLSEDSANLNYLIHLGNNYYQSDSLDVAVGIYEKVLELNPEDQNIANRLANLCFKNKDYDRTIEICNSILVTDSLNKKFIRLKGLASYNNRNYTVAEEAFRQLVHQGDSGKLVMKHLGISEFQNSSFKSARKHLSLAYKLDSNDTEICFTLGKAYLNSQVPEKGLYYLERVESLLQPDTLFMAAIYIEKQSIYSALDMHNEALSCYEIAYQYNPRPEYIFYMASCYHDRLNDKKKALEYYEKFLDILPSKSGDDPSFREEQIVLSVREIAERNIRLLREELFFEGELEE